MKLPNLLLVISGPSGVGKGTLVSRYMERHPESYLSISLTTRKPRPNEVFGKDYFFVTPEEFRKEIENDNLLEWAQVFGDLYGTPRQPVIDALRSGRDAILEIDVQGGVRVKTCFPESVLIFVLPPSQEELRRRLTKRGTEDQETLQRRLEVAKVEFQYLKYYDFFLINDLLEVAVSDLERIIFSEKHRVSRMEQFFKEGGGPFAIP
ncbi:MAG: guanylate kinase [Caldiserica bacterium]|jgi:guanylate kinase|nr:guanylate kinase [Caldisericota bacterium]MDH7562967.1 guanylate kinase [Caldisericota bacterium]